MNRRAIKVLVVGGALASTSVVGVISAGAAAAAAGGSAYVAPGGSAAKSGTGCSTARYATIQQGVNAVGAGGTVIVCAGTYHGSVTITRQITLVGDPGAILDATGQVYGIGVAASGTEITGMTVENANGGEPADGIVTVGLTANGPKMADNVTIVNNTVTHNAGSGIDLNGTHNSVVNNNVADWNGIGINVSDDFGRSAAHNSISGNTANDNTGGCGIALADHTGAGVIGNTISGNVANDNGLSTPTAPDASAGSGVILASPIPNGKVTGNLINGNTFNGNGHGGVVVHAHAPSNFAGNQVLGNTIGTNNLRDDEADLHTTGVYLGTVSALKITVSGNKIGPDYYGIFTAGPVTVSGSNTFVSVTHQTGHVASF